MDIRWLTAFLDFADAEFEDGCTFWTWATGTTMSPRRGEFDEFVTLVPSEGDAYLRAQRLTDGPSGVHLDLHVSNEHFAVEAARSAGATVVAVNDVTVMQSPCGFMFCISSHSGEHLAPPAVVIDGTLSQLGQVSIDIPAERFDEECTFWSDLTGWGLLPTPIPEFVVLDVPRQLPFRVIFQRLQPDRTTSRATGHLDISGGESHEAVAAIHIARGSTSIREAEHWITLADPTGREYCVTGRDTHR